MLDPAGTDPVDLAVLNGTKKRLRIVGEAAEQHFNAGVDRVAADLAAALGGADGFGKGHTRDDAETAMKRGLGAALHSGVHADFTKQDELAAYTRSKLRTRSRCERALPPPPSPRSLPPAPIHAAPPPCRCTVRVRRDLQC